MYCRREQQAPEEFLLDDRASISPADVSAVHAELHMIKPDGKSLLSAMFNSEGGEIRLVSLLSVNNLESLS